MPFVSKIGGGSARRFGLTRRSTFFSCVNHPGVAVLNNSDKKCYYPANYAATATTTNQTVGPGCYSGGGHWGSEPNAGCCHCAGCPYANCVGCFSVHCQCYDYGWNPIGNVGGGCYAPYYTTQQVTNYSCPQNTGVATLSGQTCVYPATYNATEIG